MSIKSLTISQVQKVLDSIYSNALSGIANLSSAEELALEYKNGNYKITEEAIDALIKYEVLKASSIGLVSNLGGLITMPISLPTNIASSLFIHLRLTLAIAYINGQNINSERIKSIAFATLLGSKGIDLLKEAGVELGKSLAKKAISKISRETINRVNQKVGQRFITKFGEKGVINLHKYIPFIGGVVGGTIDGVATFGVGKVAKKIFN